jgi:hypothetical protein
MLLLVSLFLQASLLLLAALLGGGPVIAFIPAALAFFASLLLPAFLVLLASP